MLTADDRKIRTVDRSLEVLARGLGSAIKSRHPDQTVDEILADCPNLKDFQRTLYAAPTADPSTMLTVAIDKAAVLGVDKGDLHQLRVFRNKVTHKATSTDATHIALDASKVHTELTRAVVVLERVGCVSEPQEVKRCLAYYLAGAPDPWVEPAENALDGLVATKPQKPPRKKTTPRKKAALSQGGLSADQEEALQRVRQWWQSTSRRFVITGPAGTGKTRMIAEVIAALGLKPAEVKLVAPTNKACDVLRSKLAKGLGFRGKVSTLHSLLYKYQVPPAPDGEDLAFKVIGLKAVDPSVKLLVCDEASMLADIDVETMQKGYRTLFLGDPAQLPPVLEGREENGRQAGTSDLLLSPDAELTTIHRQSESSSILEAADIVRSGGWLQPTLFDDDATHVLDEAEGHVTREEFLQLLKEAEAVLVARNVTRIRVNEMIRELRGYVRHPGDWIPKRGEILVSCDKISGVSSPFPGEPEISNGQQLVVDEVVRVSRVLNGTTGQEVLSARVRAHFRDDPSVVGEWPISHEMLVGRHIVGDEVSTRLIAGPRSGVLRCDWGYALTVHKAQGSEWGRVVVIDHGSYDRIGARQWNYVALTRARQSVTVVRLRQETALLG